MKIVMIVAAHKAYRMPEDPMYLPLHVGKAGKSLELGFQGDDTGDNISEKNPEYCELTGLTGRGKTLTQIILVCRITAGISGGNGAAISGTAF